MYSDTRTLEQLRMRAPRTKLEGEGTSRDISDYDTREFCHEDAHRGQFDKQNAYNGYHVQRCHTRDEMTKTWPLETLDW